MMGMDIAGRAARVQRCILGAMVVLCCWGWTLDRVLAQQTGRSTGRSTGRPSGGIGGSSAQGGLGQTQNRMPAPGASSLPTAGAANRPLPKNFQQLKVMAVVNGEQVTRQQLAQECLARYGKEVLESMVNKQIIMEALGREGATVTQKEVNDEIKRLAKKFKLSLDQYLQLLENERGISPQQYASDIVWPMLALRRLAKANTQVTQEDVNKAWESDFGPKVKVRMISVSSQEKAAKVQQLAAANPKDFPKLAKEHSEDYSAAAYGVIPPVRKHLGEAEVEQVVFNMKVGDVSNVVFAANQYLIFKCEAHVPPVQIPADQQQTVVDRLVERIREHKTRQASGEIFKQYQDHAEIQNVLNDPKLSAQMPGVAATVNRAPITMRQLGEECLLRHGQDVLEGEVNRRVLDQELARRKLMIADQDIDREIERAAGSYGFLQRDGSGAPDVNKWLEHVVKESNSTVDLYVRDAVWPSVALKKLVREKVTVSGEDLRKAYEANYGPRVQVQAIVLSNQRLANKVFEMARANNTESFFGELAGQYSTEPVSRSNQGKVPPIRRYGGQPNLEEEAFRLKPGELSGIVVVGERYILLRCLGYTTPVEVDYEAVKEELKAHIREKKLRLAMSREFDHLREAAQIDNFLAGISQPGKKEPSPTAKRIQRRLPFAPKRR